MARLLEAACGITLAESWREEGMSDDVTWWKTAAQNSNQNEQDPGTEIPGDTEAPDIVGRTGEEMPEVSHDDGQGEYPDDNIDPMTQEGGVRKSDS